MSVLNAQRRSPLKADWRSITTAAGFYRIGCSEDQKPHAFENSSSHGSCRARAPCCDAGSGQSVTVMLTGEAENSSPLFIKIDAAFLVVQISTRYA